MDVKAYTNVIQLDRGICCYRTVVLWRMVVPHIAHAQTQAVYALMLRFHLDDICAALIGNEWRRSPVRRATNRRRLPSKVDEPLTLCKCGPGGNQSVRRVCYLEANVVHRGGSNQKYRNKMAASRDSVTGKYFM